MQKIRKNLDFRFIDCSIKRKHSICSDMTVYNSIIFALWFNEWKGIDLPQNKPLPFQQFPSARNVQF